jgi:hypothetical protein
MDCDGQWKQSIVIYRHKKRTYCTIKNLIIPIYKKQTEQTKYYAYIHRESNRIQTVEEI